MGAKCIPGLDSSGAISHTAGCGLECALGSGAGADDESREAEIPRLETASFLLARVCRHCLLGPWT
jgi:hypothetical protein